MKYQDIDSTQSLEAFCEQASKADVIGFDTEFVSEDTFRPELCLIQVIAADQLAVIDPQKVDDLSSFWNLLTDGDHVTLAHAAREEWLFCWRATGKTPRHLFDTQLAAAFVGMEYPISYAKLVRRLLKKTLPKGETRTDWRRRPLTKHQIEYALHDVVDLTTLHDKLNERLDKLGRVAAMEEETCSWEQTVEASQGRQRWRRVSGISGLDPRAMAIVREVWLWRYEQAEKVNKPAKWVLRDDLVIELARRKTADAGRIESIRGMQRRDYRRLVPELSLAVERGLNVSDDDLPRSTRREMPSQLQVLAQLLGTALTSICHDAHVSPSLVGTTQDVRDLIAHHLHWNSPDDAPPRLAQGWRAEIVGERLTNILTGNISIRIADPLSNFPLAFDDGTEKED